MKTFYFLKSTFPYLLLPVAPGAVQFELARLGLFANGAAGLVLFAFQVAFTLVFAIYLGRLIHRRCEEKSFVRMSSVSKKVFHRGCWMPVEQYLDEHHNVVVSHALTPEESEAWVRESEAYVRGLELRSDARARRVEPPSAVFVK
jgi:hypothetical protein